MVEISERMTAVRKDMGLTQKEMAEYLGISIGAMQNYEYGRNIPKGEILLRLADTGYDINWFLTGEGDMMLQPDSIERKIVWNVAMYLCKRMEFECDENLFANTFIEIHDWMMRNETGSRDNRADTEVTAQVIDFAIQRLKAGK